MIRLTESKFDLKTFPKYIVLVLGVASLISISEVSHAKSIKSIYITSSHSDLYGEQGILTNPRNSGREWEKIAGFKLTGESGEILDESTVGIRIHGGSSRKRGAKKSFKIYFRSEYGQKRLNYDLFGLVSKGIRKKTKKLVLRAGFNDSWNYDRDNGRYGQKQLATYIKDQVARDMHLAMGQDASHGEYIILYLNGSYQGIYNAVEAVDEDNFESDLVSEDDITVMSSGELKNGQKSSWDDLINASFRTSPSDEEFLEQLSEHLDIENMASYLVLNFWIQNYDWPHHNWKAMKLGSGAKWKFFMWDAEYSFGSGSAGYRKDLNVFKLSTERDKELNRFVKRLLKNKEFTQVMYEVYAKNIEQFSSETIKKRFNEYKYELSSYMDREADVIGVRFGSRTWERAVGKAKEFTEKRNQYFLKHLKEAVIKSGGNTKLDVNRLGSDFIKCVSKDFEKSVCLSGVSKAYLVYLINLLCI